MATTFYSQIGANKRNSLLLALVVVVLLGLLGFLIGWAFFGDPLLALPSMGLALVVGFVAALVSYYAGSAIVLAASGAKEVTAQDNPQLINVVQEMALAANVPMPRVYLIDDTAPNAFATGRDPAHASVAITIGLLQKLDREELQGVMAHELSHVRNFDIRFSVMVGVLVGSIALLADFFVVAVRTDPSSERKGISLVVVDADTPGFTRTGPLKKIGLPAQDTAELSFADARIPKTNVLGELGEGLAHMRHNLPIERMSIAITAMARMRATFEDALEYSRDRRAFGQRIIDFQANRFYLAELATEIEVTQTFIDRCIVDASGHTLDATTAAMAKWWATELHQRVIQRALQLHGGYGFMREYAVARDYMDSRVATIFGGTTEIMKEIIGRQLAR